MMSSEKNSSKTSSGDSGMSTVGPVLEVNCLIITGVRCSEHVVGSGLDPAVSV